MSELIKQSVDEWLNNVSYDYSGKYVPSTFALNFVNFIKLVNGGKGEDNATPIIHYQMLDQLAGNTKRIANLCSRGIGKTSIFAEYLFLYIGLFNEIEGFAEITGAIYVSDSMENGVKSLRKNIEYRYYNSPFLQEFIPKVNFTDAYIEFHNASGGRFGLKLFGAKTGLRGTKIYGKRPILAVLDDLVSDDDARSPTVMSAIKDTVYKGVDYALSPTKRKIVLSGTPFNKNDILYEAVESGGWNVNVYPICEKFPCTREEFKGAWEDRFSYDYVNDQYQTAMKTGQLGAFYQELMLRIMDEEDRLVLDSDIVWYDSSRVKTNKGAFNFYITTDFATSENKASDYSVISVWAYNNNGDWLLVDGICARQLMDKNIDDLFRLVSMYKPQQVGIEVSGQQGGFISWIYDQMMHRNIYFTLASEGNSGKPGIRPSTNKLQRFNVVLPWFKTKKIWLPEDLKNDKLVVELTEELRYASPKGFKSKHDDVIDTVSMLALLTPWKPSEETVNDSTGLWEDDEDSNASAISSYII